MTVTFWNCAVQQVIVHQPYAVVEKKRKGVSAVAPIWLCGALFDKGVFDGTTECSASVNAVCEHNDSGDKVVGFYATVPLELLI